MATVPTYNVTLSHDDANLGPTDVTAISEALDENSVVSYGDGELRVIQLVRADDPVAAANDAARALDGIYSDPAAILTVEKV